MTTIKVPSASTKGKYYEVDLERNTCTCIGYAIRKRCHHLDDELKKQEHNYSECKTSLNNLVFSNGMDAVQFIDKYSEETLDELKLTSQLIERHGRLWRL